jgi:hypothetical protein
LQSHRSVLRGFSAQTSPRTPLVAAKPRRETVVLQLGGKAALRRHLAR